MAESELSPKFAPFIGMVSSLSYEPREPSPADCIRDQPGRWQLVLEESC